MGFLLSDIVDMAPCDMPLPKGIKSFVLFWILP